MTSLKNIIEAWREEQKTWIDFSGLSDKVIDKASKISILFENSGFYVYPTCSNSVQFEKEIDGVYMELEIFEDKEEFFIQVKEL
jgi:hypothetical protein